MRCPEPIERTTDQPTEVLKNRILLPLLLSNSLSPSVPHRFLEGKEEIYEGDRDGISWAAAAGNIHANGRTDAEPVATKATYVAPSSSSLHSMPRADPSATRDESLSQQHLCCHDDGRSHFPTRNREANHNCFFP